MMYKFTGHHFDTAPADTSSAEAALWPPGKAKRLTKLRQAARLYSSKQKEPKDAPKR